MTLNELYSTVAVSFLALKAETSLSDYMFDHYLNFNSITTSKNILHTFRFQHILKLDTITVVWADANYILKSAIDRIDPSPK